MDRRDFIKTSSAAATLSIAPEILNLQEGSLPGKKVTTEEIPWYRRVTRWGQTNITEKDPVHYDIEWWGKHWRATETQGVIINAGKLPPLVSSQRIGFTSKNRWTEFVINSITDHEVIVIS